MAVDWNRLLDHIVKNMVVPLARTEAQLDATAVQDMAGEAREIGENQDESAERLAPAFARGMELAMLTDGPIILEDNTPEHSDTISALARYLVATDLAASQSSQLADGHYMYTFEVNWPRLREAAKAAGVEMRAEA